jgi:hypothetical protein
MRWYSPGIGSHTPQMKVQFVKNVQEIVRGEEVFWMKPELVKEGSVLTRDKG